MPKIKSAVTGKYTKETDKDTTFAESAKKKPNVKKAVEEFLKEGFEPIDADDQKTDLTELLIRFGKYLLKK